MPPALMPSTLTAPKPASSTDLSTVILPASEAKKLILKERVSGPIHFRGVLDLSGEKLTRLPDGLSGDVLNLHDTGLEALPAGLSVGELIATNLPITRVPASLSVRFRLTLDGCARLQELPVGLHIGSLSLQDCVSLERLPEGLDVCFLNINRCDALHQWPQQGQIRFGHLSARDCLSLRQLPAWLTHIAQLDISGCRGITQLPQGLRINGWLDVAGSGLTSLPTSPAGRTSAIPLRWRGVRVDERIAFQPETITGADIMAQDNAEVRRVMMERIGYERFLSEVNARILDRDHDAGGERLLVHVDLPDDEPFVAISVKCPSTGRQYVLRVPPTIQTAQAASAWVAGFDDAGAYKPVIEA